MPRATRLPEFPLQPRPPGWSLHRWLYEEIRRAIVEGRARPGARLPSTRSLARQEGVARVTVVAVFEQLQVEGYLCSRAGSGTVVARTLPDGFFTSAGARSTRPRAAALPALSRRARAALSWPLRRDSAAVPFAICVPGVREFPLATWAQLAGRRWRLSRTQLLERGDPRGWRPLREAIAAHLGTSRSVRCDPDRIVIVSGTQQAFDVATRLTCDPGDPVWMEDPGYPGAVRGFQAGGARVVRVPVDDEGLDLEAGRRREPHPRLVYLTPAHQFPLGQTMSLQRRLALLAWARRRGCWIFEDDYDGEYRYDVRPIGALQGQDHTGHVIYVGTFNKMLFPTLRLGYMVLPAPLVDPFLALRDSTERYLPSLEQAVLGDFMQEGHFERHLRRSRALYLERRDALLEAGARRLAGLATMRTPAAGFQVTARLLNGLRDTEAEAAAAAHGLEVAPLSGFYEQPSRAPRDRVLLGFAALPVEAIRDGVERLARALADLKRQAAGPGASNPRGSDQRPRDWPPYRRRKPVGR